MVILSVREFVFKYSGRKEEGYKLTIKRIVHKRNRL